MMPINTDPNMIAARLRGLFAAQDGGDPAATALRLDVSEVALRMSVDELAPHPTIEVLIAAIQYYGVDPQWLITGEYSPAVHQRALEFDSDASAAEIAKLVANSLVMGESMGPSLQQPARAD